MTIQQIVIFQTLCSEMNYSKAAEKLFMTRQAVRQNVSAMETELGGTLFDNDRNHISLTSKGRLFRQESAPVLKSFETMMEHMYSDVNFSTPLNLGISVSLLPDFLPSLKDRIRFFCKDSFPNVDINLAQMNNDDVVSGVLSGKLSMGIIMDLGDKIDGLSRYPIIECRIAAMVEKSHRLWNRSELYLKDLDKETVQVPGLSDAFLPLFRAIKKEGLNIKLEVSPHFYQVYYKVRDTGFLGLNRYFPPENDTPDSNRDIPLADVPPLCAAVIVNEDKLTTPGSKAFITPFSNALKNHYRNEPFIRQPLP